MADYFGRYPHTKCENCDFIYPEVAYDGPYTHKCGRTTSNCSECGLKHDNYSSGTTGLSPCLAAIKYRLDELEQIVKILASVAVTKPLGINTDLVRAIYTDDRIARIAQSLKTDDKPDSEAT